MKNEQFLRSNLTNYLQNTYGTRVQYIGQDQFHKGGGGAQAGDYPFSKLNLDSSYAQGQVVMDFGNPTLFIVRGLPGSGKSTFAKSLGVPHIEADMYFIQDGKYLFDPTKMAQAHAWCLKETMQTLKDYGNAVVSNTFTQLWEMEPYITFCEVMGISLEIVTTQGSWDNIHGVPQEFLSKMKDRWEEYPK